MDTGTYEQLEVPPEIVGDAKNFMLENQEAIVATNEGRRALHRAAGLGRAGRSRTPSPACRATGPPAAPSRRRSRPATRSTVPLFITTGEKIKVDTRDGSYLGRVTS